MRYSSRHNRYHSKPLVTKSFIAFRQTPFFRPVVSLSSSPNPPPVSSINLNRRSSALRISALRTSPQPSTSPSELPSNSKITPPQIPSMVLKIRLARFGKRNAPFYNIVVAQARSARNSKPLEVLGTINFLLLLPPPLPPPLRNTLKWRADKR